MINPARGPAVAETVRAAEDVPQRLLQRGEVARLLALGDQRVQLLLVQHHDCCTHEMLKYFYKMAMSFMVGSHASQQPVQQCLYLCNWGRLQQDDC